MTKEQKSKIVKISLAVLLLISILLSCSGILIIRSYDKSFEAQVSSYSTAVAEAKAESKRVAFREISRSRGEAMERIDSNDDDILALQNEVRNIRIMVTNMAERLDLAKIEKLKPTVEETVPEPVLEADKTNIEETAPLIPKRPLWKKVVLFWK